MQRFLLRTKARIRDTLKPVGEAAVELLIRRLADPARPSQRVVINPILNLRETTGPAADPNAPAPGSG